MQDKYEKDGFRKLTILNGLVIKVNEVGEVFSQHHLGIRRNGRIDNRRGRKIKPALDKDGYYRCTFSHKGKRESFYVHKLIALAFIPNPNNKPTVNHIDGVKTNNRVSNLEWATYSEQKVHAIENRLCDNNVQLLSEKNRERSIPVIFNGIKYKSVNEASKANHRSWHYTKNNAIKVRVKND